MKYFKVYFITGGYDGCYYVRCLLPLIQNGWYGAMTSLRAKRDHPDRMLAGAKASDVVVFQRPMQLQMLEAAKILKQMGKKIVFDNDDTYRADAGLPPVMEKAMQNQLDAKVQEIDRTLKEFAKLADLVTVTTPFLAKEYEGVNKNVVVLPNFIDPDDWSEPKRNDGTKVRIGLVGSTATTDDYEHIIPLLEKLKARPDVQIVLFALPPKAKETEKVREFYKKEINFWENCNAEIQPFTPIADYMDTLNNLRLDILLIPRKDSYFNHCKSNVKFLEASICEIPVIAQGFADGQSPYEQNPEDAKHMLIAKTPEDWDKYINLLIDNQTLRRGMGAIAKTYVIKNYNIHDKARLWKEAYQKLWQQNDLTQ